MSTGNICKFCAENQSRYVCPKCGSPYCSLTCYKSSNHLECTEKFYKDCIEEELNIQDSDGVSKREMIDILKRVYGENDVSESDSDDDEFTNINERLNGIDLDNSEQVWSSLTDTEKAEFEHLVKSGDITKILPQYTPWWCLPIEKQLVSEVDKNINDNYEFPSLVTNIPKLSILSKKPPSEYIQWNVVNIITTYVFLIRYYNGKHKSYLSEFVNGLYNLSKNLSVHQNFDSYDTALKSVELCIQEHEMFKGFLESFRFISDDLEIIFSNGLDLNCNYNIKLALSDVHNLMTEYKNKNKNVSINKTEQGEFNRKFPDAIANYSTHVDIKTLRLLLKKIEYLLSWANEKKFQE